MKITSGRIQRAGINPNNGMTLGFRGLGQNFDALNPSNPVPSDSGYYVAPAGSITDTPNPVLTSEVMGTIQSAMDASQSAPQTASLIPPQSTVLGIPTNTMILILMGVLGAMILLPPIEGRRR